MNVGDQVTVLDTDGRLRPGVIVPVPQRHRNTPSDTHTSRGGNWRVWVRLTDNPLSSGAPWPYTDVATNRLELADLKRRSQ